ncbi:MAG: helix-turn-helix domain-containing protein [Spirochaetota bacterium]
MTQNEFVKFEENPYNPESKGPEEIVRLFYLNNVPIIPVVSKRGLLLGILTKESVISELSDLERVGKQKIDAFIIKISKKMTLDELLPVVGNVKEFIVINLFGDIYGKWSRLDLFAACEQSGGKTDKEAPKHREEQVLEWMIYLVLEHIPRPLYALNEKGKTIFYNSHFEDLYNKHSGKDVDAGFIEATLSNPDKNDFFYKKKDNKEMYFYNKDMMFYYEKMQLVSDGKNVGYLIYIDNSLGGTSGVSFPGINMNTMSLNEMLESAERSIIVDAIRQNNNSIPETAKKLKLSGKALVNKIKKYGIKVKQI